METATVMTPIPFKTGTDAEIAALRDLLARNEFTETAICERFKVSCVHDAQRSKDAAPVVVESVLDLMVLLFMDGESVARKTAEGLLSRADLDFLTDFGLLRQAPDAPDSIAATVGLYPLHGLYLVSDMKDMPEVKDAADIVYPALTQNTRQFLQAIPTTPCDAFLELCGGTGIAALRAARAGARRAVSIDIAERATHFAEFNARLSGVERFEALHGDLYAPVAGQTFDRIAAHPPYIASFEHKYIFRDAGLDGEQITRAILMGLPRALRPDGRFYLTAIMAETRDASIEKRIRAMLGPAESEFDVLVMIFVAYDPMDYYFREARQKGLPYATLQQREKVLNDLGVSQMLYASYILRRTAAGRKPLDLRRTSSGFTVWQDIEWAFDFDLVAQSPAGLEQILKSRPIKRNGSKSLFVQQLRDGKWEGIDCEFRCFSPFLTELNAPYWTSGVIQECDGSRTTHELLRELTKREMVPSGAPALEFARFIAILASGGFIEMADFPLAPRAEKAKAE